MSNSTGRPLINDMRDSGFDVSNTWDYGKLNKIQGRNVNVLVKQLTELSKFRRSQVFRFET